MSGGASGRFGMSAVVLAGHDSEEFDPTIAQTKRQDDDAVMKTR